MGDRGNICIKDDDKSKIYFYTHWTGSDLFDILQNALKRGRDRWNDDPYLARIIFSEMIKDDVMDNTGYGISTYISDNEHPIFIVSSRNQKVYLDDKSWSFEDFLELTNDPRDE